jgi:hypothetical protein
MQSRSGYTHGINGQPLGVGLFNVLIQGFSLLFRLRQYGCSRARQLFWGVAFRIIDGAKDGLCYRCWPSNSGEDSKEKLRRHQQVVRAGDQVTKRPRIGSSSGLLPRVGSSGIYSLKPAKPGTSTFVSVWPARRTSGRTLSLKGTLGDISTSTMGSFAAPFWLLPLPSSFLLTPHRSAPSPTPHIQQAISPALPCR